MEKYLRKDNVNLYSKMRWNSLTASNASASTQYQRKYMFHNYSICSMKKLYTLFAVLVGASVMAIAQPKLEIVGGDTYDWGTRTETGNPIKLVKLAAKIQLKNVGNQELKFDTVKVGCGCTAAPLEKKNLKPGESTNMNVTLNVGLGTGEITKSLTIFANDESSKNGRVMFLKTNIVRPITMNPQSLNFTEVVPGQETSAKTTFKNTWNKAITFTRIFATKGVKVDKQGPVKLNPGDSLQVTASYTPTEDGYFNSTLIIETDSPEYPPFEVSAYGNVKNPDPNAAPDPNVIKVTPTPAKAETPAAPAAATKKKK